MDIDVVQPGAALDSPIHTLHASFSAQTDKADQPSCPVQLRPPPRTSPPQGGLVVTLGSPRAGTENSN